jgi:phage gpG-like protein
MVSSAQQNFETEGRPGTWVALKSATKKFKEKHGWTKILFRSGQLKASITGQGGVTGNSATIGSNKAYARIQNDGGTISMPARVYKTRHRTDAKGNLLHQTDIGMGPHYRNSSRMLVFAKASHKRVLERQFTGEAYAITIPARPFLLVQQADVDLYNGILTRFWFTGEVSR